MRCRNNAGGWCTSSISVVTGFLDTMPSPHKKPKYGPWSDFAQTPLGAPLGALDDSSLAEKVLQNKSVDINDRDVLGRTALHICAMTANAALAAKLLKSGIDGDAKDVEQGRTALHYAILYSICEFVSDDSHSHNDQFADRLGLVRAVCQGGVDMEAQDNLGRTALHYAVICDSVAMECLLEYDASTMTRDSMGMMPLNYAHEQQLVLLRQEY